jgi:hypothetical protein
VLTRLLAACLCVATFASTLGAQASTGEAGRLVPFRTPVVGLPLTPYSLQRALADIAWAARLPIGYEAPEDEPWQPAPTKSSVETGGHTIAEILNEIVARQPRYAWTLDDGVIHLRPKASAADPGNILNREVEEFAVDQATLQQALQEVHFTLRPGLRGGGIVGSGPAPSTLGLRHFSVRLRSSTVQGVLDAIVKAHGASSWSLTYTGTEGARQYRITFHTFDGWGTTW